MSVQPRYDTETEIVTETGSTMIGLAPDIAGDVRISKESALSLHSDRHVDKWINGHLSSPLLQVEPVPLRRLDQWKVETATGNITHDSGRFFAVTGIAVRHRTPHGELEWDQPVIDQPEVGILGILAKRINGVLHFCLQAKEEPGNINSVQLSPTVQATYSNYTQVHGGTKPPFVEYFLHPQRDKVLFAKLQTEDGGRFLYKSNRNMIVRIDDDALEELPGTFIWLTLRQISRLLHRDNLVHACTRSILSCLLFGSAGVESGLSRPGFCASSGDVVQWLDDQKAANHMLVKRVGLNTLQEWAMDEEGFFSHRDRRFFRVAGMTVSSAGREVGMWSQPILASMETGIIGLLTRTVGGRRYFLMQAKPDPGNRGTIQVGPTVQFTPGNYLGNVRLPKPFLFDEFMGGTSFSTVMASWQSEEGARFFRERHLHRILQMNDDVTSDLPPEFRWLSEAQIRFLVHLGESVNSCARSILSCLL